MSNLGNDIIIGGGDVGKVLSKLLKIDTIVDIANPESLKLKIQDVELMHICFPYTESFIHDVVKYFIRYSPKLIIIHSTIKPGTTDIISEFIEQCAVYSPIRGVHSRFAEDMKLYTKFYAISGIIDETQKKMIEKMQNDFGHASIKWEEWSNARDLEFAKIMADTTYYGWIIIYRYLTDIIATQEGIDPEKIWQFASEIHKNLGNRPVMRTDNNGIGGHCVLPNLDLIQGETFDALRNVILRINNDRKNLKL